MPSFKLDLLGGQFFYEGAHTSFSGNADLTATPAVKLTEDDMIVPTLSSQYRRTREVRELVGGGFLTQETLATLLSVKYIRRLNEEWAVKPALSYKNELLNESEDEELGNGLFDYHKASVSLEAERRGEYWNFRPALAAYAVRYYHYRALTSGQEDLGAEINSGDRVLDFNAYDASLSVEHLLTESTMLSASALFSYRPFLDQKIVTESGTYIDKNRDDHYLLGALAGQQKLPALGPMESAVALSLSYIHLLSNQHNYDASRTRFNPDYYDYGEWAVSPQLAARFWEKLSASLGYELTRRRYPQRPVQTEDGSYSSSEKVWQMTHTLSAQFSWQIYKGLSAKTQASYRAGLSNVTYQRTYKYNYVSAHYFAGLGMNF